MCGRRDHREARGGPPATTGPRAPGRGAGQTSADPRRRTAPPARHSPAERAGVAGLRRAPFPLHAAAHCQTVQPHRPCDSSGPPGPQTDHRSAPAVSCRPRRLLAGHPPRTDQGVPRRSYHHGAVVGGRGGGRRRPSTTPL